MLTEAAAPGSGSVKAPDAVGALIGQQLAAPLEDTSMWSRPRSLLGLVDPSESGRIRQHLEAGVGRRLLPHEEGVAGEVDLTGQLILDPTADEKTRKSSRDVVWVVRFPTTRRPNPVQTPRVPRGSRSLGLGIGIDIGQKEHWRTRRSGW